MDCISAHDYDLIYRIVERAHKIGVDTRDHVTQLMDVRFAYIQFNMRLDDWLLSDDDDFAHDFCGIQKNMNRKTGNVEGSFLPLFAGRSESND